MSKQQDKQQLDEDRQLVRRWLRSGAVEPLVIRRRQAYQPWEALCPNFAAKLRGSLRSLAVLLANALPISSWKTVIYRLLGGKIGRGVYIGPDVLIDPLYPGLITLHDGCLLGIGCRLLAHEITASNVRLGRIVIGAGSVVGAYATVRSGVSVGEKVTIGFNSFVNRDVPDGATVVGVPARTIETGREPE